MEKRGKPQAARPSLSRLKYLIPDRPTSSVSVERMIDQGGDRGTAETSINDRQDNSKVVQTDAAL